jgi:RNA polymerase sigma-70 factor (ECF subfamily)
MSQLAIGRTEAPWPLHGRHAAPVCGPAARSLDWEGVAEISPGVFPAAWRRASTLEPARGSFGTRVLPITRTRVINALRHRGRRPRTTSQSSRSADDHLPGRGPGPDKEACRAHRRAVVRTAVDALLAPQSEALRLTFLERFIQEQATAFLDVPLSTTKSRIRPSASLRSAIAARRFSSDVQPDGRVVVLPWGRQTWPPGRGAGDFGMAGAESGSAGGPRGAPGRACRPCFSSRESSGTTLPVYSARGAETPHGGRGPVELRAQMSPEDHQRWQIATPMITKALAWIGAGS